MLLVVYAQQNGSNQQFTGSYPSMPGVWSSPNPVTPPSEYVAGKGVAALVYHRRQHVINLFIWPDASPSEVDPRISHNGYNLLHWTAGPMTYWAVSDVSTADLEKFRSLSNSLHLHGCNLGVDGRRWE